LRVPKSLRGLVTRAIQHLPGDRVRFSWA
jgi:hypothetical protein